MEDRFIVSSSKRKALDIASRVKSGRLPPSFICHSIESATKRRDRMSSKLSLRLQIYKVK